MKPLELRHGEIVKTVVAVPMSRVGVCLGVLLALVVHTAASESMRAPLSRLRFEVSPSKPVFAFERRLTELGLVSFKGTIRNESSEVVRVTRTPSGAVSVVSFRCDGKDVPHIDRQIVFDEDPRAFQRSTIVALRPKQSATFTPDIYPWNLKTLPDGRTVQTIYPIERPAHCEVTFKYDFSDGSSRISLMSNVVAFDVASPETK